jgi:hypothetical protein
MTDSTQNKPNIVPANRASSGKITRYEPTSASEAAWWTFIGIERAARIRRRARRTNCHRAL